MKWPQHTQKDQPKNGKDHECTNVIQYAQKYQKQNPKCLPWCLHLRTIHLLCTCHGLHAGNDLLLCIVRLHLDSPLPRTASLLLSIPILSSLHPTTSSFMSTFTKLREEWPSLGFQEESHVWNPPPPHDLFLYPHCVEPITSFLLPCKLPLECIACFKIPLPCISMSYSLL